jgi:hypothetical protein
MGERREFLYNSGVPFKTRMPARRIGTSLAGTLLLLILAGNAVPLMCGQTQATPPSPQQSKIFAEKDALQVMEGIRKSFEANNRNRLIGMFDAKRMPDFATFRDQVSQLFTQYESFQVRYHVTQTEQDGAFGSIVAEFVLQAYAVADRQPDLRRRAQLHLIVAWDGTGWKIADVSPRSLFQ